MPEDFWCPEVAPVPGGLIENPLPAMSPPAEHDGTMCLKWDDTLWSHADHFKVPVPPSVMSQLRALSRAPLVANLPRARLHWRGFPAGGRTVEPHGICGDAAASGGGPCCCCFWWVLG